MQDPTKCIPQPQDYIKLKIKEEVITLNENIVNIKESELIVFAMEIASQTKGSVHKYKDLNNKENSLKKREEQHSKSIAAQEEREIILHY